MKFRRALCLALSAVSAFALCACTGNKGSVSPTPKPTPTATPQYLWTTEYTEADKTSYSLSPLFFSGDGFYASGMEVVGEDIPDEVINEAKKHKKEVVNDGRYNIYENRLCFIGLDGKVSVLEAYSQMAEPENENGWKDYSALTNIGGVIIDNNQLYSIEYVYESGNSKPERLEDQIVGKNYNEFGAKWYIRHLSSTGEELACSEINNDSSFSFLSNSFVCVNGKVFAISVKDGRNGVAQISLDGDVLSNTLTDGTLSKIITGAEGKILAAADTDNGCIIYEYNTEDCSLILYASLENAKKVISGTRETDFFYDDGINLNTYSDGESNFAFNWSAVNISPQKINSDIYMVGDDECVFTTSDGRINTLRRINYDAQAERKTLVLVSLGPTAILLDAVSKFNESHYDVKIVVEDISAYAEGKTLNDAVADYSYNRLGGEMPDIIDLTGMSYENMCRKSMLEDLYPFIEDDAELDKSDFIPSVLTALEVDGKLYCTASSFSIDTVLGQSSVVGDKIGWNYSDYFEALISMGAGTDGFDSFISRDDMLREILYMDMDSYINWENLSCNFTDGKFNDFVGYLSTFPADVDYAQYTEGGKESSDIRLRNGRQMLQILTLYGIDDALRAGYEFADETTFVGYPTDFGTGNCINVFTVEGRGNLAMTSACRDKNAAWEFLRCFFMEEYQKKSNCFPVNIHLFEKELEEAMVWTPVLSKKGEQLYDDDGQPRYYEAGTMYLSDYTPVKYYPLTVERAEQLKNLIYSTTKVRNENDDIYRIVKNALGKENVCETVQQQVTQYLKNTQ